MKGKKSTRFKGDQPDISVVNAVKSYPQPILVDVVCEPNTATGSSMLDDRPIDRMCLVPYHWLEPPSSASPYKTPRGIRQVPSCNLYSIGQNGNRPANAEISTSTGAGLELLCSHHPSLDRPRQRLIQWTRSQQMPCLWHEGAAHS